MPKAFSMEFRKAVAKAYDESGSSAEVAELMGCSESWVRRLMQGRRERGTLGPKPPKRPDTRKLDDADLATLRETVRESPDLTLGELAAALEKAAGKKLSVPTVLAGDAEAGAAS